MRLRLILSLPIAILAGCGSFQLAGSVVPKAPKTTEQTQLDNLTCKDKAKLEANTSGRQAGAFALGLTIVGAPVAIEMEKAKQREVYKECMEARGYHVTPVGDAPAQQPGPFTPVPPLAVTLPPPVKATPEAQRDEVAQLKKLKEMRDQGLITAEDYDRKRKEILDKL